jgi:hemerythrin-like domain-containing protein
MSKDLELRIIHDHTHLKALLGDLERSLVVWSEADVDDSAPYDEAKEILALLKEDTYEHFEREEHGLFPNLRADFPELSSDIDELLSAHNEICEVIEGLERKLLPAESRQPEDRARTVAFGQKLGQLYWQHTAAEWEVIRSLLERLDDDRRAVIVEQLKEI